MNPIKVLIPTDFSVQSEYAYIMVRKLAEKVPMEITFIHVMNVPDTVVLGEDGLISTCGEIDSGYIENQKLIAERKLADFTALYGTEVRTQLKFGRITDTILDAANSGSFDLIVMGTKGAWGLKEKLSGTETQIIARKSAVPVLSLMCDRSELAIEKILLVHDFTDGTKPDMSLLRKITAAFKPELHFLQIQQRNGEDEALNIRTAMADFANRNELGTFIPHLINDVDIEAGVVHFTQMNDMDIICIGTHGKGGLWRTNATERLINHMFKPIISFHLH